MSEKVNTKIYMLRDEGDVFSIYSEDFEEGKEIPKQCGYKHGNKPPRLNFKNIPKDTVSLALIMDDPDAMGAVGKVWVHWLGCNMLPIESSWADDSPKNPQQKSEMNLSKQELEAHLKYKPPGPDMGVGELFATRGKTDFGEISYGGPAPPDKRHTYVFKAYALDTTLDLNEGYSKQELEDAMKDHIIAEAKLTGTFAP